MLVQGVPWTLGRETAIPEEGLSVPAPKGCNRRTPFEQRGRTLTGHRRARRALEAPARLAD